MRDEEIRLSLNKFIRLYFDSCNEVYKEINFDRITGAQFKYLKTISKHNKITITELAKLHNISKPTITEVVNKLEKAKILYKSKSETDKRVSYISLTEIGEILATTNKLESEKLLFNLKNMITREELHTLKNIFDKLGVKK